MGETVGTSVTTLINQLNLRTGRSVRVVLTKSKRPWLHQLDLHVDAMTIDLAGSQK